MKLDMSVWQKEVISAEKKKAMPILSFPGAKMIGASVDELVKDGHLQALCMESIAKKYDMGLAVSLMDLSVEAEAFGCAVHYSEDEVPTVNDALIHDEEEAEGLQVPKVGAGRTGECVKGIREASERITDRPLFAGCIGPYTLAGRMLGIKQNRRSTSSVWKQSQRKQPVRWYFTAEPVFRKKISEDVYRWE